VWSIMEGLVLIRSLTILSARSRAGEQKVRNQPKVIAHFDIYYHRVLKLNVPLKHVISHWWGAWILAVCSNKIHKI